MNKNGLSQKNWGDRVVTYGSVAAAATDADVGAVFIERDLFQRNITGLAGAYSDVTSDLQRLLMRALPISERDILAPFLIWLAAVFACVTSDPQRLPMRMLRFSKWTLFVPDCVTNDHARLVHLFKSCMIFR